MTRDGLESALAELDWPPAILAMRVDVHRNTVYGWRTGTKIPGSVGAYLGLALAIKRLGGLV